jgi:hypothetical protein
LSENLPLCKNRQTLRDFFVIVTRAKHDGLEQTSGRFRMIKYHSLIKNNYQGDVHVD